MKATRTSPRVYISGVSCVEMTKETKYANYYATLEAKHVEPSDFIDRRFVASLKDEAEVFVRFDNGEEWAYCHSFLTIEAGRKLAAKIEERGSIDPRYFRYVRTAYGSEAYDEAELVEAEW